MTWRDRNVHWPLERLSWVWHFPAEKKICLHLERWWLRYRICVMFFIKKYFWNVSQHFLHCNEKHIQLQCYQIVKLMLLAGVDVVWRSIGALTTRWEAIFIRHSTIIERSNLSLISTKTITAENAENRRAIKTCSERGSESWGDITRLSVPSTLDTSQPSSTYNM